MRKSKWVKSSPSFGVNIFFFLSNHHPVQYVQYVQFKISTSPPTGHPGEKVTRALPPLKFNIFAPEKAGKGRRSGFLLGFGEFSGAVPVKFRGGGTVTRWKNSSWDPNGNPFGVTFLTWRC